MTPANRNILWAEIFVDELVRCGLKAVCIAPGSRSTPLVMAFAAHPSIKIYSHLDERSASFFALGLALASNEPVAILCTSGTATANFYPAIIEAYQSQVPLLVLTADRSHELRDSGANQTINQVKMYGDHVLWAVDVALPESDPPAVLIRSLRTLACRAYAKANDLRKGPVHLNFPFRKPLEPTPVPTDNTEIPADALARPDSKPFTVITRGQLKPSDDALDALAEIMNHSQRGLIFSGPGCHDFRESLEDLSVLTGFVLLADPLSGVRYSSHLTNAMSGYDTFLRNIKDWPKPDLVLRFGAMPTSQAMENYLSTASAYQVSVRSDGVWSDADHRIDHFIEADPRLVCQGLLSRIHPSGERSVWYERFMQADQAVEKLLADDIDQDAYFDGDVVADVVKALPDESILFIGNSLPVRLLDQFGLAVKKDISVFYNRGASGIDGIISSALGVGAARPGKPLVLVIGDISFYHDMNGLLAIQRCGIPITIVLLNNDGGGIFHMLPIKDFEPTFTDLFITPHGLDFSHVAHLYGMNYYHADDRESFRRIFVDSITSRQTHLIEVRTDALKDLQRRKEIIAAVQSALKSSEPN